MNQNIIQIVVFLLIFCACGCQNEPTVKQVALPKAEKKSMDGTAKMVKLLNDIAAKTDPMKVAYFDNSLRADFYKRQVEQSTDLGQQFTGKMFLGYELLNAGKNEEAVVVLSKLLQEMNGKVDDEAIFTRIKRILALSYMRLGEQNNCLEQSNEESCLIPITKKGVYSMTSAVKSAIGIYKEMLTKNPEDLESVWMLNFAYMTLGEYPDKVPKQWRLPLSFFNSDISIPRFENVSAKVGLNTVGLSGGVALDDFNNDGKLDVVASSWRYNDQLRVFINKGDGKFEDITDQTGLLGINGGLNINHMDYNNDGWMDIFVMRGAWFSEAGQIPNSLLKNNGDGTFTDVTELAGVLSFFPTQTSAWADFNLDGHLDLFIGNELGEGRGFLSEFYMNNGDGTFVNKTAALGTNQVYGMVKGVVAGDVNNDGRADLYLSRLGQPNILLINEKGANGEVLFKNVSEVAQVTKPIMSFPTWMWDINNDGWQDILVACFGSDSKSGKNAAGMAVENARAQEVGAYPRIYINNQDGRFSEQSKEFGIREAVFAMGSNYGDIDNDGYLDIYFGTGEPSFTGIVPNKMYRNNQGKSFQDVTTAAGVGHIQKGHAVGFGDMDNDGDQDLFCVLGGAFEGDIFGDALFLNPYGNTKNWMTLRLEGTQSNRSAIGAKVKVVTENKAGKTNTFYHWVSTGGSFGGNSLQLEMGLNDAVKITSLEITWPNANLTKEVFENIEVNRVVKIKEGEPEVSYVEEQPFELIKY